MLRLYRFRDLRKAGIVNNRQTLSQWIKKLGFPEPFQLGPNTAAWFADEVDAWVERRWKERRRSPETQPPGNPSPPR